MKKKSFTFCLFLLFIVQVSYCQVTIGNSRPPDPNSVLDLHSGDNKGFLLPRLVLESFSSPAPLAEHVKGMVVYNSGTAIPEGYYYNNGNQWILLGEAAATAWRSIDGDRAATSYIQDIYQQAGVAIGSSQLDASAQFQVNSNNKGVLLPILSAVQRDNIGTTGSTSIPDGLLIYNNETHCFNYYHSSAKQWLSLCGNYQPARIDIGNCEGAIVNGTYKVGTVLNETNTYQLNVNVITEGSYRIDVTTTNGYLFSSTGTFTNAGPQTVTLRGEGTPIAASQVNGDPVTVSFNSVNVGMPEGCTLPSVHVTASSTKLVINCSDASVSGTYEPGANMVSNLNYVTVPYKFDTNSTPGSVTITTNSANGVTFSGTQTVSGDGSIILRALGTAGSGSGTFTYTYTVPGTAIQCSFNVTFATTLGTQSNPANSCLAILQADTNAKDGVFWIQNWKTPTAPVRDGAIRTFCDMTNGGYTLVQSYSEYAMFGVSASQFTNLYTNQALVNNNPQGVSDAQNAANTMPYENYRLPLATMREVSAGVSVDGKTTSKNLYRMRIVQDAANLENSNDYWANNNYFVVDFRGATIDLLKATFSGSTNVVLNGKLFTKNISMTAPSSTVNAFSFDQSNWSTTNTGFGFWNAGNAMVLSLNAGAPASANQPNVPFTYIVKDTNNNDVTVTGNNIQQLNDLGNPYGGENQINHHIGKCGGATADDYLMTTATCTAYWNSMSAHRFNMKNGNYQGRYIQWFVK